MEKNHSWFPKEQQDDEVEMKVTHDTRTQPDTGDALR